MAYAQVRTILVGIQKQRRRLIETARATASVEEDDYLNALLARAEEHDRRMQAYLDEHAKQADDAVLDTWMQYTEGLPPGEDPLRELTDTEADQNLPYGERVEQALLKFDEWVLNLYDLIRKQSNAESVGSFVDGLILMESQKARDNSRNYVETQDLRSSEVDTP